MSYLTIFEKTVARLQRCQIEATLTVGSTVVPADLAAFEDVVRISFPESLSRFYLQTGNGVSLQWDVAASDCHQPFCRLQFPALEHLRMLVDQLRMENECLATHNFWENQDPELARQHFSRQTTFFPVFAVNSDLICIESRPDGEGVVFHRHDWSVEKFGDSGVRLADSLDRFLIEWSSVGFVEPTNSWWPDVVARSSTQWAWDAFDFPRLEILSIPD